MMFLRGCTEVMGFSLVAQAGAALELWCVGFSLWWLFLLQSKGSGVYGLSSCGSWALLPHRMWHLPRPGIEPISPVLAGRFLTTGQPRKCLK